MPTLDELIQQEVNQQTGANGAAAFTSANQSPDEAAKILNGAQQYGVPAPVISLNPKPILEDLKASQDAERVKEDQFLRDFIGGDPLKAQLINDDHDKITPFGFMWSSLKRGYLQGQRGRYGSEAKLQAELGLDPTESLSRAKSIEDEINALPEFKGSEGFLADIFGGVETIGEILAPAAVGAVAGGPAGFGAGALVGGTEAARVSAGNWYLDHRHDVDDSGAPVSESALTAGTLAVFGANAILNSLGIRFAPGTGALLGQAVEQAVKNPTVAATVARAAARLGQAGVVGAGWGAAGEMVNKIAQVVGLDQFSVVTDPKKLNDALAEVGHAAAVGAAMFGALHVPAFGKSAIFDQMREQQYKADAEQFQDAYKAGQATKTFERSPSTVAQFAEQLAPGATVKITPEAVRALYGDKPIKAGDGLLGDAIPDLQDQLARSDALGGADIEVLASQYLEKVPPELNEVLKPDLRYRDGGVTETEIKEVKDGKAQDAEVGKAAAEKVKIATDEYVQMKAHDEASLKQLQDEIDAEADPAKKEQLRNKWTELKQTSDAWLGEAVRNVQKAQAEADRHEAQTGEIPAVKVRELPLKEGEEPAPTTAAPAVVEAAPTYDAKAIEAASQVPPREGKIIIPEGGAASISGKPYGYWLLPDGQMPKVGTQGGHDGGAIAGNFNDTNSAIRQGQWIRIITEDNEADGSLSIQLPSAITAKEKTRLLSLLAREKPDSVFIDAMADEGYGASRTLTDRQAIAKFIREYPVKEAAPDVIFPEVEVTAPREEGAPPVVEGEPARTSGELPPLIERALTPAEQKQTDAASKAAVVTEEVNKVRRELYLDPILEDPNLGLNEAEFERYSRKVQAMHEAENERALSEAERLQKRILSPSWKAAEAREREAATVEVDNAQDMRAYKAVTEGSKDTKLTLDRDAVNEILNDEKGADSLPRNSVRKGGLDPDEVADALGFRTGAGLVRALQLLNTAKGEGTIGDLRTQRIDQITRTRMEAKHGVFEDVVRQEAEKLVLAKTQRDVLLEELAILKRRTGDDSPLSEQQIVKFAQDKFGEQRASQGAKFKNHWNVLNRAGRRVQAALQVGNHAKAFIWKQKQFLAHVAAQESLTFREQYEKALDRWDRYGRKKELPAVAQSALDQIHLVLSQLGVNVRRTGADLADAVAGTKQFLASAEKLGMDPPSVSLRPNMKVDNLTVDEFRAVNEMINWLDKAGRDMEKVIVEGETRSMERMRTDLGASVDALPDNWFTRWAEMKARPIAQALRRWRSVDAFLVKTEALMEAWDHMDPNGNFSKYVTRPIARAGNVWERLRRASVAKFKELVPLNEMGRGFGLRKIEQDTFRNPLNGDPLRMTKSGVLSIALNMGNLGNRERLTKGYGVTEAQVEAFLRDNMTPLDWKIVNGVFKFFDWMRPQTRAVEKRMNGYSSEDVVAAPIMVGGVKVSDGGYYPVMYDTKLGSGVAAARDAASMEAVGRPSRPRVGSGFTEERTQAMGPLLIEGSFESLHSRINEMIQYIAYKEPVKEVMKVLSDRAVRDKLLGKVGEERVKELVPWLEDVAHGTPIAANDHPALARFRRNVTVAQIAGNLQTLLSPNPARLMGPDGLKLLGRMMSSPAEFARQTKFAWDRSTELQSSGMHWESDVRLILEEMFGNQTAWGQTKANMARFGFTVASLFDNFTRTLTWMSEYQKGILSGAVETKAIESADARVRREHGGIKVADLAKVMRSPEGSRWLLSMFYGFGSIAYNNARSIGTYSAYAVNDLRQGNMREFRGDMVKVMANTWFYLAVPALVNWLIYYKKGKDEGPVSQALNAFGSQVTSMFPIARDVGYFVFNGGNGISAPFASALQTIGGSGADLYKWLKADRKHKPSSSAARHAITSIGMTFGVPMAAQAGKTVEFLWDLHDGEQKADGFWDFARGVRTGESRPK